MSPEIELYDFLIDCNLTSVGTRIFPYVIPQGDSTFPVIVYNLISATYQYKINSPVTMDCRFQIDAYSPNHSDCVQAAEEIRGILQSYSGEIGEATCQYCLLETEQGGYFPPQDGSDVGIFRKSGDYHIRFLM